MIFVDLREKKANNINKIKTLYLVFLVCIFCSFKTFKSCKFSQNKNKMYSTKKKLKFILLINIAEHSCFSKILMPNWPNLKKNILQNYFKIINIKN